MKSSVCMLAEGRKFGVEGEGGGSFSRNSLYSGFLAERWDPANGS